MVRDRLRPALLFCVLGAALLLGACSDQGKVSGGACVTNQNCPTGEQCIGGRCVARSTGGCKNDDACALGETCNTSTGMCEAMQVTGCTVDDNCPADQRCNTLTGVCIVGRRSCTGDAQCTSIGKHCDTTLQQCVDCVVNTDCTSPEVCMGGSCIDPSSASCTADSACNSPSTVCEAGQCVPGCQRPGSPVTCGLGQLCDSSTGRCVGGQVTCTNDSSCAPPSTICESGQCIPGCTQIGGLQCTGGNVCNAQNGRCQPASGCTTDTQCGAPASVCENSRCVAGCGQPGGLTCGSGTVCNTNSGRCVNVQGPCTLDSQCGPPTGVCESGQCIPGCTQLGGLQCTGNTVCNSTSGRCDPGAAVCTSDAQCSPPSTICNLVNGACVAGCQTTGCPSGQTCATNGHCTGGTNPGTGAALNAACSVNADCASSVCFDFGGTLGAHCVSSCGSSADCPSSFTCYDYNGAKMCISSQLFSGATLSTPAGGSCATGGECHSNFCPSGACIETCSESSDCGGGLSCSWSEFAADMYNASCSGPQGLGTNGSGCSADSDCRSGVCYGTGTCGDLCGNTADCPNDSICALVNYSICQLDFGACFGWAPNFVKACVQASHGNGGTGTPCSDASSCRSGLCFTTAGECTDACSRDADCPTTHVCGVEQYGTLPEATGNDTPVYINVCKQRGM